LTDASGDGLSFFANSAGSGSFRLMKFLPNYSLIKNFNADFGSKIVYNFTAGAPLSIEETSAMDFELYPNPVSKTLHIDLSVDKGLIKDFSIYTIQGQLIKTISSSDASLDFDVADFEAGLYLVSVRSDEGNISRKFLKQ
jgi:hypothetical protein